MSPRVPVARDVRFTARQEHGCLCLQGEHASAVARGLPSGAAASAQPRAAALASLGARLARWLRDVAAAHLSTPPAQLPGVSRAQAPHALDPRFHSLEVRQRRYVEAAFMQYAWDLLGNLCRQACILHGNPK